jgi:hypothetical protein
MSDDLVFGALNCIVIQGDSLYAQQRRRKLFNRLEHL